jgi:hypothetical protein
MQVFARRPGLHGGIDEAIAHLKLCAGRQGMDIWEPGWEQLLVQTGDGWAAHVAGPIGVSTDAQASWWGGRGSALLRGSFDFTADIVCFEGEHGAEVGRELRPNPRLQPVA